MFFGMIIMAIGVVIVPLPGPFGIPIIFLGLVIILRSSRWVKRQFLQLVHRYPQLLYPLRKMLKPRARIIAILYRQMLKLERYILSKKYRPLRRIRRWFFRKHKLHLAK